MQVEAGEEEAAAEEEGVVEAVAPVLDKKFGTDTAERLWRRS